ncbi:heavy-metal-associated domain-containing protein [Microbacterium sp. A93]|uniref:heavy-metal-associated domain-containing protein n=1 Tax=Microbacterium sp. A93 TaxID=3450716 RepID=UPI003F4423F7
MSNESGREAMNQNDITLKIDGMTCGHCVSSVTEELTAVPGISNVEVTLTAGGTSTATITTTATVENSVLEAAVIEAGYTLVSVNA